MTLDQDRRIIREMLRDDYAMLSGPAGRATIDRVKHYFHPAARLVRTGIGPDGEPFTTVMSVDDHHADVDEKLAKLDFLEEELEHDCEIFGNVARVRSVYRSVYGSGGAARENRGVNFFNLVRENGEWKIISVVWDNERDGLSLG